MGGEETMLRHQSAVGNAKKEGLDPVPGGMHPDTPPYRAGAPDAKAKKHSGEKDGKQPKRRLAWVAAVGQEKDE